MTSIDRLVAEPSADGLRRIAARGAALVTISQLAKMITQFVSVVLVARLIGPQQTGIAAMVAPLLALALLLQDLGLGQATIQSKRLTYAQVDNMFWLGIGFSIATACIMAGCAPLIGRFYRSEAVVSLTVAIAVLTIISNLGSQPLALLNRGMRFGTIAIIEVVGATASLTGSILIAVWTRSCWAVFAASFITVIITTSGAALCAGWVPGLPRLGAGIRSMVRFGVGASLFNMSLLVARNLDNVLVGRVWGDVVVGLYDRGYKLALFPLQQALVPVSRVMLPVLARFHDDDARYTSAFLRCSLMMVLAIQPPLMVLTVFAPDFINLLLGPKWSEAANIFRALAGAGLTVPLASSIMWLFYSQHRTDQLAKWGLFNALTTAVGFALSVRQGPVMLAMVYSVLEIVRAPMLLILATRSGPVKARAYAATILPCLLAIPLYVLAAYLVREYIPVRPIIQILIAGIAAYAIALLSLTANSSSRSLFTELRVIGLRALGLRSGPVRSTG